ncbi:methyl-accepting chemotaxis protein [Bacillus sp. JJ1503]|uniref:methyl-accepting chemotaxis protein n=1 Tax=Bacillus sp. JJ1503 TaxID=3122956 RepID=UPI002FFD6EAB
MKRNQLTIRRQFLKITLSLSIIIALISGAIQLYFMNDQIVKQSNQQAESVANNVLRGIEQTNLAAQSIEHQIDLKLVAYAHNIVTLLGKKSASEITTEELLIIKEQLGLAGITIIQETKTKDDYVGILSTEPNEVGISFKKFGYYEIGNLLMSDQVASIPGATYTDKHTLVLPIAQSASHTNSPEFFKYAYYHVPGTDYIINPFIKANEVYNYTEIVGPSSEIKKLVKQSDIVKEIAVLNPKVFADPSLEKQLYPPLKKVEAGQYTLKTKKDIELLTQKVVNKESYIERVNGDRIYKMFLPIDENSVIYIALDYSKMSDHLYQHSTILIISGITSLLVLFLLTARYFNRIYENIQKIKRQINLLEEGDLTVKSFVNDESELESLSDSTNRMVDKLNKLVFETQEQAKKIQRLSLILEAEASQSVEKMYEVSTGATLRARDQLYVIIEFLDSVHEALLPYIDNGNAAKVLGKIEEMKVVINDQTAATTNTTISLSDLVKSLHIQSSELLDISKILLEQINKFKL